MPLIVTPKCHCCGIFGVNKLMAPLEKRKKSMATSNLLKSSMAISFEDSPFSRQKDETVQS